MKVEVYDDIACPWCCIGTHQFHRAVEAAGMAQDVELVHRPYQLMPDAPQEPQPLKDMSAALFGPEQAEAMLASVVQAGAAAGLEFRLDRAIAVNTFTAHRLRWLALNEHSVGAQDALSTALFNAHFLEGGNIADHTQLTAMAERVGLDGGRVRAFLPSEEGVAEVREQVVAARRDGVTAVPTFVFENGERVVGVTSTEALGDVLRQAAVR